MPMEISEDNLKQGLLGLVLALLEIIRDALQIEALRRLEDATLTEDEVERLGRAMEELSRALWEIKMEQGVAEAVRNVRDGLDRIVDEVVDRMLNPRRWEGEIEG